MVEFQSHGSTRFSITIENWPKLNMKFVGKKTHSYIYYLKITQSRIREYIINKIEKDYKFI